MEIQLLCVGKVKESFYKNLICSMELQLKKRCAFEICQLPDLRIPSKAGKKEELQIINQEGSTLIKHIPKDAYVIALCIEGRELSTKEHKKLIREAADRGFYKFTYIIGGSLGLSEEVLKRADYRLSFSKMTFPHQMMRVLLLEELMEAICDRFYC